MKQYTIRDFQRILRNNGYELVRQRGSHAVYSNGKNSITIPIIKLKSVVAIRLIKENKLAV